MSTTLHRSRILGLDLLRFGAAAIVFLGHLVFNVKNDGSSNSFWDFLLSPIHTGAYAVLFFFSLSGFVLANQDFEKIKIKFWLLSRWVRLMPIFYLTYLIGLFLLVAGKGFKPNLVHTGVELTGFSGMTKLGVPAANPPLWSLSVELILSILVPLISKIKNIKLLFIFLLGCLLLQQTFLGGYSVVNATPYFVTGVICFRLFKIKKQIRYNFGLLVFTLVFFFISPKLLTAPQTFIGNSASIIAIAILVVIGSRVVIRDNYSLLLSSISARSYCLYAVHWPIIKSVEALTKPISLPTYIFYAITSLILVALVTEIVYRFVECPAIAASKRLRISHSS